MAVERIDASRRGPGSEHQIIGFTWGHLHRILLHRLWNCMTIFGHNAEGMSMQMHRVHRRCVSANQAHMHCLSVFDIDGLGIRETLAVDHIIVLRHGADKLGYIDISVNSLGCLGSSRTWINNKGTVEATHDLRHIVIVTMIPMGSYIIISDSEIIEVALSRLDGILSNARDAILLRGYFQAMPVNSRRGRKGIIERDANMITSLHTDHRARHHSIDSPGEDTVSLDNLPHHLFCRKGKMLGSIFINDIGCQLVAMIF